MFFKTVAGGYLEAEEIGNVACANRQFKETSYNPRMTTGRGCVALIGQGCSPSVPEAKKWFKIAAELHGTREALIFLGEWASGGTTTFMKFFVFLGSFSCIGLYWFELETIQFGLLLYVLALIGLWGSLVFYNSYLPDITYPDQTNIVSAKGFTMGYIGSVILLVINLIMITYYEQLNLSSEVQAMKYSFILYYNSYFVTICIYHYSY